MPAQPSNRRISAAPPRSRESGPPKRAALVGVVVAAAGVVLAVVIVTAGYTRSDPVARASRYPLDGRPSAVAVTAGRVWLPDDEQDVVWVLDADTGQRARDPVAIDEHPVAIAAEPDGRELWVAHAGGLLTRIDVADGRSRTYSVEGLDAVVSIAIADGSVWLGDIGAGVIVRLDARTGAPDPPLAVPGGVVRLAVAGDTVWVTNLESTVTPVDARSGRPGPPIDVGLAPIGLAVVGHELWVVSSEDDTVTRIDLATRRRAGPPIPAGNAPVALTAAEDVVWVVSQEDRSARAIDAESGRVRGDAIPLGSRPRGVAVDDGDDVWVAAVDSGAAIVLR